MVTLDRIKLVTDIKYINQMDYNASTMVVRSNIQREIRYKQIKPYNLYISYHLIDNKCIIEVSAKVLSDRYPELITKNNIRYCLEQINGLGICKLDIDGIIGDSKLISCDITYDIVGIIIPENLAIKSCLKNLNKFQVQNYSNCGFTVTKLVKTKSRQIRLNFYDKNKELHKAINSEYLETVHDKYKVLDYFKDKFRIEANVRTVSQIKELFQIDDNSLTNVLNSTANPLLTLYDAVFDLPDNNEPVNELQLLLAYTNLSELKNALLIKACDYDPAQIDVVLNNCLSPNTNKRKYKATLNKIINAQPIKNPNIQLMQKIRTKLQSENDI